MKRVLSVVLSLVIVLSFMGCSTEADKEPLVSKTPNTETGTQNISVNPDWPYYSSAEEIIGASTNIFTGKVTDISFEIIDVTTGKADNSKTSDSTHRIIHTVYSVSPIKNYKGDISGDVKICIIGGITGYKEDEQRDLLTSAGLLDKDGALPIVSGQEHNAFPSVDGEYLFCTVHTSGEFEQVVNNTQFAHSTDSQLYKSITAILETE